MPSGTSGKRYEQPYSSRNVTQNTVDPIRRDEPSYIRNFVRFLHSVFIKQTPFDLRLLAHIRTPTFEKNETKSASRKSVGSKSPDNVNSAPNAAKQPTRQQPQQTSFRTLGQNATKSPSPMSSMPSDFEHIFHYSETS